MTRVDRRPYEVQEAARRRDPSRTRAAMPGDEPLQTAPQALQALRKARSYDQLGHRAFGSYMRSPGTATGDAHHARFVQYTDAAEAWLDKVDAFLLKMTAPEACETCGWLVVGVPPK